MVDLWNICRAQICCVIELGSTKVHSLLFLIVRAGKHHDSTAPSCRKLDSKMAQPADSHNANAVGGLDALSQKWDEDRLSSAHKWPGMDAEYLVREYCQSCFRPHAMSRKRPLVKVSYAKCVCTLDAMPGLSRQAILALSTSTLDISESNSITAILIRPVINNKQGPYYLHFNKAHFAAHSFNNANTFMTQYHIRMKVMCISSAHSRVRILYENLIALQGWKCRLGLGDLASRRAFEDCECSRHCCCPWKIQLEVKLRAEEMLWP